MIEDITERRRAEEAGGLVRVRPVSAVTKRLRGEEYVDFGAQVDAGAGAFSHDGRPVASAEMMAGALERARSHVRREVGKRVRLKYLPDLRFERDEAIEQGVRIERLIAEMARQKTLEVPAHCDSYELATGAEAFTACWAVTVDGRLARAGLPGFDLPERRRRFSRGRRTSSMCVSRISIEKFGSPRWLTRIGR